MQDAELQVLATNIVVISVALLAIALAVLSHVWQRLLHYTGILSAQGRRDISNLLTGLFIVSFAFYGALVAMGIVGPDLVQMIIFFIVLGIDIVGVGYLAFLFIWNIIWHRKLPSFRRSREPDVEQWEKAGMIYYSTSMFNLLLAAFSFTISVVTATDATVGINIRPDPAEDVDFSRWSLSAGTAAFFFGLMLLAFGKYADLHRFLDSKGKGDEVQNPAPEGYGPTDQDEANDIPVAHRQEPPEQVSGRVEAASREQEAEPLADVVKGSTEYCTRHGMDVDVNSDGMNIGGGRA